MAVMWCPGCEKQREVKPVDLVWATTHLSQRRYKCLDCGLVFERAVGVWRRNRVYREARKSRQIIKLRVSPRK